MSDIFDQLTQKSASVDSVEDELKNVEHDVQPNDFLAHEASHQPTGRKVKDAVQELMKYGLLEVDKKPHLFQVLVTQYKKVSDILEPLDLAMNIDDVRGLAYLRIAGADISSETNESESNRSEDNDEWSHPLVRRQRLNLEQSLLVALLRQHFIAHELEAGIGAHQAYVALEDLLPQVQLYLGDMGSDAREQTRLRNLLDKLKVHGLVSEINQHDQIIIRPIIVHVANPENLTNLLEAFTLQAKNDMHTTDSDD